MSYKQGTPNGKLYVGNVKWSNDYKHVMLFESASARNNFLVNNLSLIKENVIYYNPNKYIDVEGKLSDVEAYNYLMFINDSDVSTRRYCCFVTDYEYIAPNTTRLYIELDVFQMYYYTTTFYQSFIERAIVSSSENNSNKNYLPEPISANLEFESELTTIGTEASWQPIWVLHSASYYNYTTKKYEYKGKGTNNTYGEYGRFIENLTELETLLKMYGRKSVEEIASDAGESSGEMKWQDWVAGIFGGVLGTAVDNIIATTSIADLEDHRDELIGMYAIPKWLKDGYISDGGDTNYADNKRITLSAKPLTLNNSSLANGYTPRNKKLLTSVCRGYLLANRTGLKIPFKPELFTSGTASIVLGGITMSTAGYQYAINGYSDKQMSYGEVAYSSERRVGYDANTGINKALSIIGAGSQLATSIGSVAGGIATANPVTTVSGIGAIAGSGISAIDKIGQQEAHFGNNGDLLRITGSRPVLRWFEVNPSVSECQAIDNFFDMYGYTINKHVNPSNYLNNRSNWNYIKCGEAVNMSCQCPSMYENKLKNIFSSGVTLWHDYSHFGDYSQPNT